MNKVARFGHRQSCLCLISTRIKEETSALVPEPGSSTGCYSSPPSPRATPDPLRYSPAHPPPATAPHIPLQLQPHPLPYSPRLCNPRHCSYAQFFDLQLPRMLQCRLAWVLRFSVYVSPGRGSRRTSHICFRLFPLEASLERLMAPARPKQNTAGFWSPAGFLAPRRLFGAPPPSTLRGAPRPDARFGGNVVPLLFNREGQTAIPHVGQTLASAAAAAAQVRCRVGPGGPTGAGGASRRRLGSARRAGWAPACPRTPAAVAPRLTPSGAWPGRSSLLGPPAGCQDHRSI